MEFNLVRRQKKKTEHKQRERKERGMGAVPRMSIHRNSTTVILYCTVCSPMLLWPVMDSSAALGLFSCTLLGIRRTSALWMTALPQASLLQLSLSHRLPGSHWEPNDLLATAQRACISSSFQQSSCYSWLFTVKPTVNYSGLGQQMLRLHTFRGCLCEM